MFNRQTACEAEVTLANEQDVVVCAKGALALLRRLDMFRLGFVCRLAGCCFSLWSRPAVRNCGGPAGGSSAGFEGSCRLLAGVGFGVAGVAAGARSLDLHVARLTARLVS